MSLYSDVIFTVTLPEPCDDQQVSIEASVQRKFLGGSVRFEQSPELETPEAGAHFPPSHPYGGHAVAILDDANRIVAAVFSGEPLPPS